MLTRLEFWIQMSNQRTNFLKNISHLACVQHRVQPVGDCQCSYAQGNAEKAEPCMWIREPGLVLWSTGSTVLLWTFWTFDKSNLCLVNRVKDFYSVRWHGMVKTKKRISGGIFIPPPPSPPPRACYVKVKMQANELFLSVLQRPMYLG